MLSLKNFVYELLSGIFYLVVIKTPLHIYFKVDLISFLFFKEQCLSILENLLE